ncbi:hypothetical protein POTOM_027840 [Populus tomentosa]|uniref:Uncharacterized protein n=1 Tax=Populus tomentosa TaxID=118781 RepID=A0A8X8CV90_POPTO|nr:hypothetical protein POTOM_027840 [Populus tomentosa]
MAISMMRSALLRNSLRTASKPSVPTRRGFSSSAHHDDAYEAAKWEKITYLGVATCTILAIYNLSKGHPHYETPPEYPYLHIRNKEFPWDITQGPAYCPGFDPASPRPNCIVTCAWCNSFCILKSLMDSFSNFLDQMDSLRSRRTITETFVLDGSIRKYFCL